MRHKISRNQGTTLIELMIVTVIIGLVAGMAVPRFHLAYERMRIKTGDRALTSAIRLARSSAISEKQQYGLYFDQYETVATVFVDKVNQGTPALEGGDSIVTVVELPPEFDYLATDCANDVIAFRPNGSANFTGGGNIYSMAFTEHIVSMSCHNILASTGRISTETYTY